MTRRVLHRPKGGWASTPWERAGDRLSGWIGCVVIFAVASSLAISVFGATVTALSHLLTFG